MYCTNVTVYFTNINIYCTFINIYWNIYCTFIDIYSTDTNIYYMYTNTYCANINIYCSGINISLCKLPTVYYIKIRVTLDWRWHLIYFKKEWPRSEKDFILWTLDKLNNDLKTVKTMIFFTQICKYL